MQTFIHYFLHFGFPFFIAFIFYKKDWKKSYLILIATMLVDIDHLLASPIFQADRCSIGFHYFHTYEAILFYSVLLLFKNPIRLVGIGLLFHMLTDLIDCIFILKRCSDCLGNNPTMEGIIAFSKYLGII